MATITPTVTDATGEGATQLITWTPLTTTNVDGAPAAWAQWADRCVQVSGTFGAGGSVSIQGSNDGTNWAILNNAQGTAATFTAAGIKQVVELPRYMRPYVTAGDGTTSLTVSLLMRRAQPMRV